jgi:hypothetical protein
LKGFIGYCRLCIKKLQIELIQREKWITVEILGCENIEASGIER